MEAFGDFLAIILFFIIFFITKNVVWATAIAVIIGIIQAAYTWRKHKKLSPMQWVGLVLVVGFGGATILFGNPVYMMFKTTVVCWLTALVVFIAQMMGKNGVKWLIGKQLSLPEPVWTRLSCAWVLFFIIMGLINLVFIYPVLTQHLNAEQLQAQVADWANYKLYVYIPLSIVFSIGQAIYIARYLPKQTGE